MHQNNHQNNLILYPDLGSFSEMVQLLEIVVDQDAINRLFKALTLEFTTGSNQYFLQAIYVVKLVTIDLYIYGTRYGTGEWVLFGFQLMVFKKKTFIKYKVYFTILNGIILYILNQI